MKKIFIIFALILMMSASLNVFAAEEISLGFEDSQWSENNLYPEWYGGRYIEGGKLTYVITKGHEAELSEFILNEGYAYVIGEHSYNTLLRVLDEITREWMSVQTQDEVVCIQSAWLDEINNCIVVEFYTGSEKLDATRERLLQHFDGFINTAVTDDLITLDSKIMDSTLNGKTNYTWIWLTAIIMVTLLAGTFLVWRKHTSLVYARQTVGGGIIEETASVTNKEVLSAVKAATITPSDSVFNGIMRDIVK